MNDDLISRQAAIKAVHDEFDECLVWDESGRTTADEVEMILDGLPPAEPEIEDYTGMKREFIRMAEYIDVLLICSDEQKETLISFISRLAEHMPWKEKD